MTAAVLAADGYWYAGPAPEPIDVPAAPDPGSVLRDVLEDLAFLDAGWAEVANADGRDALVAALAARGVTLVAVVAPVPLAVHPPECNADGTGVDDTGAWLVCPFCGTDESLCYMDSYAETRSITLNQGGILIVSGQTDSTDDEGDDTPGLCCRQCAPDVALGLPDGWEMDYR